MRSWRSDSALVLAARVSITNLLISRTGLLSSRAFSDRPVIAIPVNPSSFWRYWRSDFWTSLSLWSRCPSAVSLLTRSSPARTSFLGSPVAARVRNLVLRTRKPSPPSA